MEGYLAALLIICIFLIAINRRQERELAEARPVMRLVQRGGICCKREPKAKYSAWLFLMHGYPGPEAFGNTPGQAAQGAFNALVQPNEMEER
jgi:hypothetical protein